MSTTTVRNIAFRDSFQDYCLLVCAFATVPLLLVLYLPTLSDIASICLNDADYSHGLLLPFITCYLLWDRKQDIKNHFAKLPSSPRYSCSWTGFLLVLVGLFLYLVGQASGSLFASWLSLFPTLIGAVFLVFTTARGSIFVLPILLNFMAKPLPDSLVPRLFNPLQVLAANVSASILAYLDVPVHLMGNIIEIPGMRLLVEEACSGMRSVMALLTVSFIVIYLIPRPRVAQFLLVLFSLILALVLNILRVALTGILAHFYSPTAATGFFHGFSGLVVFFLGLVILYGFGLLLDKLMLPKTVTAEQGR